MVSFSIVFSISFVFLFWKLLWCFHFIDEISRVLIELAKNFIVNFNFSKMCQGVLVLLSCYLFSFFLCLFYLFTFCWLFFLNCALIKWSKNIEHTALLSIKIKPVTKNLTLCKKFLIFHFRCFSDLNYIWDWKSALLLVTRKICQKISMNLAN
jgi:hypothetical protein